MKVIRRIFGNVDSNAKKTLIENSLKVKLEQGYFNQDVDENSEEYRNIKKLIQSLNLQDNIVGTEFTQEEIEQAEVLVFSGVFATGYPQPENPYEFYKNTYEITCPECGIHDKQKAPFQMKEPKLGRHKIMQLNWINDEIFVERDLYGTFFKNLGIEKKEAIIYKKNINIKTVVQLEIPKAEFTFDMTGIDFTTCPICNRIKYSPTVSGFFPMAKNSNFSFIKTKEYFGSGHSAFNKIIVSNEVMKKMIKNKLARYYHFVPAKNS